MQVAGKPSKKVMALTLHLLESQTSATRLRGAVKQLQTAALVQFPVCDVQTRRLT